MAVYRLRAYLDFVNNDFKTAVKRFDSLAKLANNKADKARYVECMLWKIRFSVLLANHQSCVEEIQELREKNEKTFKDHKYLEALYYFIRANISFYLGENDKSRDYAEQASQLYEDLEDKTGSYVIDYIFALQIEGKAHWRKRDITKSFQILFKAVRLNIQTGIPTVKFTLAKTFNLIGTILMNIRKVELAALYLNLSRSLYLDKRGIEIPDEEHFYFGIFYSDCANCILKLNGANRLAEHMSYTNAYAKAELIIQNLYKDKPHRYKAGLQKIDARYKKESQSKLKAVIEALQKEKKARQKAFNNAKHSSIAQVHNHITRAYLREYRAQQKLKSLSRNLLEEGKVELQELLVFKGPEYLLEHIRRHYSSTERSTLEQLRAIKAVDFSNTDRDSIGKLLLEGLRNSQQALTHAVRSFEDEDLQSNPDLHNHRQNVSESELLKALYNKSELSLLAYFFFDSNKIYLNYAVAAVVAALDAIKEIIDRIEYNESRLLLLEQTRPISEIAVTILYELCRMDQIVHLDTAPKTLYQKIQYNKSYLLLGEIHNNDFLSENGVEQSAHWQREQLAEILSSTGENLEEYFLPRHGAHPLDGLVDYIRVVELKLERQKQKFLSSMKDQSTKEVPTVGFLEELEGDDAAIIEYFFGKENVFLIRLSRATVEVKKLCSGRVETEALNNYIIDYDKVIQEIIDYEAIALKKLDPPSCSSEIPACSVRQQSSKAKLIHLKEMVIQFINWFSHKLKKPVNRGEIIKDPKSKYVNLAYTLYCKLIKPIEELDSLSRVYIIPDGNIWLIPFETLLTDDRERAYHKLPSLHHSLLISYHFSLPLIYRLHVDKKQQTDEINWHRSLIFLIGEMDDAIYEETIPIIEQKWVKRAQRFFPLAPYMRLKGDREPSEILSDHADFDYVFFWSHGSSDGGIRLSGGRKLQMKDIRQSTHLKWELLMVPNCYSGSGHIRDGEGMIALNRSFISSGVKNILYATRLVPIDTTLAIMNRFFELVLNESDPHTIAQALAQAKREVSLTKGCSPRDWCGLLFIGDQMKRLG